jgi:hypothetical protein
MWNFFYSFHNKPLGFELFSKDVEDGTPSPHTSEERITDNGVIRMTDNGIERITD